MKSAAEQYREIVRHYVDQGHVHQGQPSPTVQRILAQQRSYLKLLSQEAAAIEQSVLAAVRQTVEPAQSSAATAQAIEQIALDRNQPETVAMPSEDVPFRELHTEEPLFPELSPDLPIAPQDSQSDAKPTIAAAASEQESITRYQAAFVQAMRLNQHQLPLDELLKLGLRSLQQTLRLSDEVVEAIELRSLEELEAEQQQYKVSLEKYREEFAESRAFLNSESVQDELWTLQRKLGLRSEDVLQLEREVMREAKRETYRDSFPTIVDSSALAEIQALEKAMNQELFQADSEDSGSDARASQSLIPLSHTEPEKRVLDAASPVSEEATALRDQSEAAANGLSDAPEKSESTAGVEPIVLSDLEQSFQELEQHLGRGGPLDWWQADQSTFEILLKLAPLDAAGWLTIEAINQITQTDALQRIDRLWSNASQGRYGLFAQREVYRKVVKDLQDQYQDKMKDDRLQQLYLQEFVRRIGWWDKRLQFLKFYKWLDFQTDLANYPDIPLGQFPAYWFWAIPRKQALQLGGLGFGQGGWRVDTSRLRAWANKLRSCKLEPYQK